MPAIASAFSFAPESESRVKHRYRIGSHPFGSPFSDAIAGRSTNSCPTRSTSPQTIAV
jgi:hypothetical protein